MRSISVLPVLLAACASTGAVPEPKEIETTPHAELIYRGDVSVVPGAPAPFRYERWSTREGLRWTSTHLTFALPAEALVITQRAVHSPTYAFREFDERHDQLGTATHARLGDDGTLTIGLEQDGRTSTRIEHPRAPVVAGPTLFGFVREHWPDLVSGEAIRIQFLAPQRGRTYAFTLRVESQDAQRAVVVMRPRNILLRMAIRPMRVDIDTTDWRVTAYEGMIPPHDAEGKPLTARVEYVYEAPQLW